MNRLLIIGGSDAGISAALRAREVDRTVEISVLIADSLANYRIFGLPLFLSGEGPDWPLLAHRTVEEISREGIDLVLDTVAQTIDPVNHTVSVTNKEGQAYELGYDRLVIATGAVPVRPAIEGLDLPGVYLLRSMEDSFAVQERLYMQVLRSAVIIGGGYIGLGMADALT